MPSLNLLRCFVCNDYCTARLPRHRVAVAWGISQLAQVSHANFSVFATWPPSHTGCSCGQDAGTGVGAVIADIFCKPLLRLKGSSLGADGESGLCVAGTAGTTFGHLTVSFKYQLERLESLAGGKGCF